MKIILNFTDNRRSASEMQGPRRRKTVNTVRKRR